MAPETRIRRLTPVALVLLALAGCSTKSSRTISLDRNTIQAGLAAYFPLSSDKLGDGARKPLRLTLTDPDVLLESGSDHLGLRVRVHVEFLEKNGPPLPPLPDGGPPKALTGTIVVRGAISYQPEKAAFFYSNPTLHELTFPQLPPQFETPVRELAEALLAKHLQANPIYTLPDSDLKSRAAKLVLKAVTVRDGKLEIELGR